MVKQAHIERITGDCCDNGQRGFHDHWADYYMLRKAHCSVQTGWMQCAQCPTAAKLLGPLRMQQGWAKLHRPTRLMSMKAGDWDVQVLMFSFFALAQRFNAASHNGQST